MKILLERKREKDPLCGLDLPHEAPHYTRTQMKTGLALERALIAITKKTVGRFCTVIPLLAQERMRERDWSSFLQCFYDEK